MWGTKTCSGGLGWAVQFGLSANSCVLHPKQRASNSTCCDGQRQHNLSEHLREKQEEPRRSCTAISLACPHGVSVLIPLGCRCCKLWLLVQLIMPHLPPLPNCGLLCTSAGIGLTANFFFDSTCNNFGLVAHLSSKSIPDLSIPAPKMVPQARGWLAALTLWNLHTPGITTDVSAEWLKEKCFNFTAFNRNIHYSTVYSAVNRIKPNATCKNDKFSLYLSLLQSYFVHNPFMANIYIIMIYYTTVWQHRHVSEMAPGEGKPNRPYCHPTADSLF